MGWDGIRLGGAGWGGVVLVGWDQVEDGVGWDGLGWHGMGWDGMG